MAKQWEPYKEEILRLYMIEDLTLDQVVDFMSTSRGFDRKKHQYEHRLKIWGARKYMKREEWEYISHQHRKQNRTRQNPNVYVDGVLLGRSRLNRALQRYQPDMSLARKFGRAPSPEPLDGHPVHFATSRGFELSIDWPESLPWLQFERRFTITLPQSTRLIHLLALTVQKIGLLPAMKNKRSFDFARAICVASRETPSGAVDLPWMLRDSWRSTIPSNHSNGGGTAAQLLRTILFQVSNKSCKAATDPYTRRYMKDRGEHLLVLFHELHKTHPMVLNQLLTWTDPTSEAIIESLYEDAVRYGDTAMVSTLLDAGRDVNALLDFHISRRVFRSNGRLHLDLDMSVSKSTSLQWAASVCNVNLATLLIDAGAKVDFGNPTPLALLCSNIEADDASILRFASILISHGARVNISTGAWASPLLGAVVSENTDLVRFLLHYGAMDVINRWMGQGFLKMAVGLAHDLSLIEDYELVFPGELERGGRVSALQSSMVVNNSSIKEMLIHSVSNQENGNSILEWALVTACVAGEEDMVRRLLAHIQAYPREKISLVNEIILATAWDTDCRIAHLLFDDCLMQTELRKSSLSFFQAAALHGNVTLIKLLDSKGFDVNFGPTLQFSLLDQKRLSKRCQPPPLASTPIGCAIWMDRKDAIESLLAIGADLAAVHLVRAIRSESQDLLSQVLKRCDHVDELWDGQRALDVAIRYCRGMALIRQLINSGAVIHGHEIVDAVRSGDQEVVQFFLPSCGILATNKEGENVLEAACCTGDLDMIRYYFTCRGTYSSRAMLLAASRAVNTHDYHTVDYLVTTRPSGPIDEYEASALALSIRMNDSVLVNILTSDQFGSSPALSLYCPCCKILEWPPKPRGIKDWVYPLDYNNHSIGIWEFCKSYRTEGIECRGRLSPTLVAALMGQGTLVRTMLNRGHPPDAFLVHVAYHKPPSVYFVYKEIRDVIMAAYTSQISLIGDRDWNQSLLRVSIREYVDIKIIQEHIKNLPSLDFWDEKLENNATSPLELAAYYGRFDVIELLLKAGASPDAPRQRWPEKKPTFGIATGAFVIAIRSGGLDIASLLLNYGADINAFGSQPIIVAIEAGNFEAMTFLLENGIDINTPGMDCRETPLQVAANRGALDAVELLFTHGVDIQGRMRIHFIIAVVEATEKCYYAMANFLKKRGGWTEQDQAISKTPRVSQYSHNGSCARFLYDDPSLEPCEDCLTESGTSSSYSSSTDDESTTSDPADLMVVTEKLEDNELCPLTDGLSILELEYGMIENGETTEVSDLPLVPYGRQDRELDNIVRGLLLEDGFVIDME